MRTNVIVKKGWVLQRCAEELALRLADVTINAGHHERTLDLSADLHYYMPAKDIRKYPPPNGHAIGFFTHGEETLQFAPQFEACVAMNQHMAGCLRAVNARHVTLIRPGVEPAARPVTFGVVGRCYHNGRKGEHLVKAAMEAGFTFVACGTETPSRAITREQWPCPQTHTTAERSAFYASIDYLVVTATEEGGPMPVLEAIAHRVPVIAPDVGWCWEFPCYPYERGNVGSLLRTLRGLIDVPTWEGWGDGHRLLFEALSAKKEARRHAHV